MLGERSATVTPPAAAAAPDGNLGDVLREYLDVAGRLQRTHEALQGEIVRLRQELASKDRELELRRRLAALGELAAGVAHEVRNPLGAIQLYSGLLRSQCRAANLVPALQLIEKIEAGIAAIDTVVKDTLALAPRDRRLAACPLAPVLAAVADAVRPALDRSGVRLELQGAETAPAVRADAAGLQRVLVNLVVNAAEAAPAGTTVTVAVSRPAEELVEVQVLDEGPGLPDDLRDRIFDPFFTTKEHGTGLGLTIAHRLIEAFGGRLTAGNRPTGGAVFTMALPAAWPDADERATPCPSAA